MILRWVKFNAVGLAGVAVQIASLALFLSLGVHYLVATILAVESAILHNYFWHARWTWRDRPGSLLRFNLSNGGVSLISNLLLMRVFAGWLGMAPLIANLAAIACTSVVNFLIGELWVFTALRAGSHRASSSAIPSAAPKQ